MPDVMIGLIELCRALAGPGGKVASATPAYPPFFEELPPAGVELVELPLRAPDGGRGPGGARRGARGRPPGASSAAPTTRPAPCFPARARAIAEACGEHDAWVLADEIHAPLVLPGAAHVPWLEVSDAARARGIALTSRVQGVQRRRAEGGARRDRLGGGARVVARCRRSSDHAGPLGVVAAEAAFADGDAWLDAVLAQLDANRTLLGERLAAELPGVAGRRRRPPTWPGSTAGRSGSATSRPPRSWSAAAWRSAAGSTTGVRARATSG